MRKKFNIKTILLLAVFTLFVAGCTNSQKVSETVKDVCREKGKLECDGNCEDGFGADCYFDSTKYNKEKLETGFTFPEETRKACFGIHSSSICDPCYNKFELNKNGVFEEVTCEEFFQAIEEKNKKCHDCIEVISSGCC